MDRRRVANKYLINLCHVRAEMSSDDHERLLDINKSWVNSCAEARSLTMLSLLLPCCGMRVDVQ